MKIPPKKPHFFKPILPGFKNGIKIPVGFLKYLKGYEHIKRAVLKRGDKKWRIKVNEHRFEEGNWGKFVEENDLQLRDLLVFRHEGNMEFEVSVFDSTHCDGEYGEYLQEEGERGAPSVEEISKKFRFKDLRANASLQLEGKKPNLDAKKVSSRRIRATVPASTSANANSQFVSIIRPYAISRAVFFLPSAFARLNGLMRRCKMTVKDERQRLWPVQLGKVGSCFAIIKGWKQFREANAVQVGDYYKFELIDNGIIPIAYFHPVRANASFQPEGKKPKLDTKRVSTLANVGVISKKFEVKAITTENPKLNIKSSHEIFPKVEAAEDIPLGYPHFSYTITPYCLSRDRVQLPVPFARENGLTDRKCTIMIRDEQRSWTFALFSSGKHTYIKGTWHKFCIANCLKEGDQITLEIVENGMNPTLRFHDLRANASLQLEGKKPNLDVKKFSFRRIRATVPASTSANANSRFVSIIHPYTIGRAVFYLPSAFARPNGLMRRCKMMLKDERQRLWPVQLGKVGPRFAIKKGWTQFREANAVQVGDYYKFELIDNGIIPIAYFHLNNLIHQQLCYAVRANASFQPEVKKPNVDTKRVSTLANASTQFISTIRPYCIHKPCLYLPSAFAKSNGLVNRRCKMILRDEKQRPWAVWLVPRRHRIAITRGWLRFREANDVQVGDTYKLELIDNGTIPVLYFHCKYSGKDAKASEKPLTNTNQQSVIYKEN